MTHRARLLAALALTAVLPLAVFALGTRREADRRLGEEADRRARARAGAVRSDVAREAASVRRRLRAAAARAEENPRLRRSLRGGTGDREHLLAWAGRAMRSAGLDALQLLAPDGRILSSGHYRNEWGRRQPGLGEALSRHPSPALARLRQPEGAFLVLASAAALRVGGRTHHLVGGLSVADRLLPRMDRAAPASVTLRVASSDGDRSGGGLRTGGDAPVPPGADGSPAASGRVVRVDLPVLVPRPAGVERESATLAVRPAGVPLADLRRGLDRWLLLTASVSLAAALLAAWWLAGRMSRPLEALAVRARRLDLDRLDVDFPTGRDDEVGELARTLRAVADRLRRGKARLRAVERRAALGDLARQVNHDVRNALAPLRAVLDHLGEAVEATGGEAARVLEERGPTLEAGLAYLEELAGRYRDLSTRPDPAPCDVSEVVRRATDGLADADRLRVEAAHDLPPGRADPVALRRIVENLARNALQAAGADGTVRVAVSPADGVRRLRIEVEDDGPGMSEEELDRAFEAFHTTREEGTGLGLAIVRRLVHDLDGELTVESEPGSGTRFAVLLPTASPEATARAPTAGGDR